MSRRDTHELRWVLWLLVSLVVLISLPGMMSANYLPKTFWAAVTIGIGFVVLPPRYPGRLSITPLGSIWLIYLFWALLSALWALSPRVSFERWLALLLPALAYLLAKRTRFWESDIFWVGFCILAGLVALIGILQYFFPSFPLVNSFPGTKIPRATLGHRNYAGMYFMLVLPFLVWGFFHLRGKKSMAFLAGFFLVVLFILIARNRGSWLGIIFGVIFVLIANLRQIPFYFKRIIGYPLIRYRCNTRLNRQIKTMNNGEDISLRSRKNKIIVLTGISCLLVVILLVFRSQGTHAPFNQKKADIFNTLTILVNGENRIGYWESCLGITDPITGCGSGNFPIVITPTLKNGGVETLNYEVHNDYLQAYLDLGLPGLLIFVSFFGYVLHLAWKGRNRGITLAAGAAITGLVVMQFTTFTSEKVSSQIWLAGVLAIINSQKEIRPLFSQTFPRWLIITGNYGLAFWLIIFAVIVGYTIRGDRAFRREWASIRKVLAYQEMLAKPGEYSDREIDNIQQLPLFERLKTYNRFKRLTDRVLPTMLFDANMRHIICHQFADLAMDLEDSDMAAVFAHRALEIHPNDWSGLKHLAESALQRKDFSRARRHLNRGIDTFGYNPHVPYFCLTLSRLDRSEGREKEAESIQEKLNRNRILKPLSPAPGDRGTRVPLDFIFDWSDCNAATSYDFFLWKVGEDEPESPTLAGLSESRARPAEKIEPGTTYLWRVRPIGRYGELDGNIWVFRTVREKPSNML